MVKRQHAHVWRRVYSFDQFKKIHEVASMRRELAADIAAATKFARCQIRDPRCWYHVLDAFDGVWQGEPVELVPVIRPLFMEYARHLYEMAACDALEKFPGFTDHVVEDGPDLGERRLVFTDSKHDLALPFMINRMWSLHEAKAVSVSESIRAEPDERGGRIGGRRIMNLFVTLDRPMTDRTTWEEVRDRIIAEGNFPVDRSPRQCDFHLAGPMRCEMSLPELAYLNWDVVRKPLGEADIALFKAVATFDPAEISRCLAAGANPNAIDKTGETPLMALVSTDERQEYVKPEPGESGGALRMSLSPVTLEERQACIQVLLDAGADLDLCGPNECTPLSTVVLNKDDALLDWLLAQGADDTIINFDDEYPGGWPTVWDYAASDLSVAFTPAEEKEAERTWRALRRHRQAPDGTPPDERPEW